MVRGEILARDGDCRQQGIVRALCTVALRTFDDPMLR